MPASPLISLCDDSADIGYVDDGLHLASSDHHTQPVLSKSRSRASPTDATASDKFKFLETLRVQVPDNHIHTQNLYYSYYYLKPTT